MRRALVLLIGFLIFGLPSGLKNSELPPPNNKLIVVELNKRMLFFFVDGQLKKQYPVSIGRRETPTPVGKGYIHIKRERMVFRYIRGPKKGKMIRYSKLQNGEVVKIDYKKMRGLGFRIPGYDPDKYSIHSTTEEDVIGKPASLGCVRMRIKDMLEFFPLVNVGTGIIIKP